MPSPPATTTTCHRQNTATGWYAQPSTSPPFHDYHSLFFPHCMAVLAVHFFSQQLSHTLTVIGYSPLILVSMLQPLSYQVPMSPIIYCLSFHASLILVWLCHCLALVYIVWGLWVEIPYWFSHSHLLPRCVDFSYIYLLVFSFPFAPQITAVKGYEP